jgi:N-acyl-L-homoserine lactone synthetase
MLKMAALQSIASKGYRLEFIRGGRGETELLRFRHQVFREELGWLPESGDGLDRDEYDAFSDNYAVLAQNKVLGSVRLTQGHHPFMLEREFLSLLSADTRLYKDACCAEITRMAVSADCRGRRPEAVARLLYFILYQWARARRIRVMYFVVEPKFLSHLRQLGFPVFALADARVLSGDVLSQAGYLNWDLASPAFIHWLRSVLAVHAAAPAQSRGCDCWR